MIGIPHQAKNFQDRSKIDPEWSGMGPEWVQNGSETVRTDSQRSGMDIEWILSCDHIQLWLIYQYSYLL